MNAVAQRVDIVDVARQSLCKPPVRPSMAADGGYVWPQGNPERNIEYPAEAMQVRGMPEKPEEHKKLGHQKMSTMLCGSNALFNPPEVATMPIYFQSFFLDPPPRPSTKEARRGTAPTAPAVMRDLTWPSQLRAEHASSYLNGSEGENRCGDGGALAESAKKKGRKQLPPRAVRLSVSHSLKDILQGMSDSSQAASEAGSASKGGRRWVGAANRGGISEANQRAASSSASRPRVKPTRLSQAVSQERLRRSLASPNIPNIGGHVSNPRYYIPPDIHPGGAASIHPDKTWHHGPVRAHSREGRTSAYYSPHTMANRGTTGGSRAGLGGAGPGRAASSGAFVPYMHPS